ncbi:MAG: glycosyltransferase family 2 protein [Fuerstiella sp.]|nr:glycosyltransferase family 2 protein [Fuerstiella sp.]
MSAYSEMNSPSQRTVTDVAAHKVSSDVAVRLPYRGGRLNNEMQLDQVTPLILTYNEAANIRATLNSLPWAKQIMIVDSGSVDETLAIVAQYPQVTVCHREFDDHTSQWNFGLDKVSTEWVLTLDADYLCPDELPVELGNLNADRDVYYAHFRYCIHGIPLHACLYPARAVLFRTKQCRYICDGHTQTLDVSLKTSGFLRSVLSHDDRKSLSRWCLSQNRYARLEAEKLLSHSEVVSWKDKLRRHVVVAPVLTLFYCLFAKRLVLDGWAGIFYSFQRVYAEMCLSLELLDVRLRADHGLSDADGCSTEPEMAENSAPVAGLRKAA